MSEILLCRGCQEEYVCYDTDPDRDGLCPLCLADEQDELDELEADFVRTTHDGDPEGLV